MLRFASQTLILFLLDYSSVLLVLSLVCIVLKSRETMQHGGQAQLLSLISPCG